MSPRAAEHREPAADPEAASSPLGVRPAPVTVVFAEDHPLYRDGLARALGSHPGLRLVGEACEGAGALGLIEELEPDVALLDVKMPGLDGVEVGRRVAASEGLPTRVVLLSAYLDPSLIAQGLAAGAAGYVGKDATREEICAAVLRVGRGGTAFSDSAREGLVQGLERLIRYDDGGTTDP